MLICKGNMANSIQQVDLAPYRPRLGAVLKFSFFTFALLFLYRNILGRLILTWVNDQDYSHGFIVPLISCSLIWRKKTELMTAKRQPHWSGFPVFIGGLLMLAAGIVGAENFISRVSFMVVISGLILIFYGMKFFQLLLMPVAFLILMIPPPSIIMNRLTFPLQILASKLAFLMLYLFQVPSIREGNLILLPNITLEVVEACSGIRSLVALITLALVFSYFLHSRTVVRILFTLSVIPIAVISNAMRVAGTGMLAYYANPQLSQGFFHEFAGWIVFMVAVFLLLAESRLITCFTKRRGLKPPIP